MFTTARMAYQHNRIGSRAVCFELKSNKSLKTSKIYKISKNSKVSKRWLDLQALQGSEAPRSLQPAVASKKNKAEQSKAKLSWTKQNKVKQSEKKNKARPASAQLASWVWCSGDDQRLNAIYERERAAQMTLSTLSKQGKQCVVVLWDDPHHHDSQSACCLSK